MNRYIGCWLGLLVGAISLAAGETSLTAEGIAVRCGMLELSVAYPKLGDAAPSVSEESDGMTLRYADGASARVTATPEGAVTFRFERKPEGSEPRLDLLVPFVYGQGGRWNVAGKTGDFPRLEPAEAVLAAGAGTAASIVAPTGEKLTVAAPGGAFWQLQDNRRWQWNIYQLILSPHCDATGAFRLDFSAVAGAETPVRVDRFGQSVAADFPEKVHSEEELRADVERDRAYYEALHPPATDEFGGMPGSRERFGLKATGFFRLDRVNRRDVLVTPAGNLFFALGVCCIGSCDDYTYVTGREKIYQWLPEEGGAFDTALLKGQDGKIVSFYIVNYIRKTGKPYDASAWQGAMIDRLKKWGFNSQGAFGDNTPAGAERRFGVTPMLPVDAWRGYRVLGADLIDPYEEANQALLDREFSRIVAPRADDPLVIGYFSGNERHYSAVGVSVAAADAAGCAAKREWIGQLQLRYPSIGALNAAWGGDYADWRALEGAVTPGNDQAEADLAEFADRLIADYFLLIRETFRRYDPNHLYLGERFTSSMAVRESFARACAAAVDVFSINYYTMSPDPAFLNRLAALTGRPLLLSEWSYGTPEQGLSGGVRNVADQRERALAYRRYVETATMNPAVVGVQWFSAIDQALTGRWFSRYNGESMNIGLVNVADRPFRTFLDGVMTTNYRIYPLLLGEVEPLPGLNAGTAAQTVQIPHIWENQRFDGTLGGWPNRPAEEVNRPAEGQPPAGSNAALQLTWDRENLYFHLAVGDATPGINPQPPERLWDGDAVEFFFGAEADPDGALLKSDSQLVIGANAELPYRWYGANAAAQPEIAVRRYPAGDGSGYVLEGAIPWKSLGVAPEPGRAFRFDCAVDFGGASGAYRQGQLLWNGNERNSADRSGWGRAIPVE